MGKAEKAEKKRRESEGATNGSAGKRAKESAGPSETGASSSADAAGGMTPIASHGAVPPTPPPAADEDSMPHLCCSVCLSFPEAEVLQCCAGHILCKGCYERVCHEEKPSCPSCREPLDLFKPIRNMLAERSIAMLSVCCPNAGCEKALTRGGLEAHLARECAHRQVCCKFGPIGCKWEGVAGAQANHEDACKKAETPGWKLLKRVLEKQEEQKGKYEAELRDARAGLTVSVPPQRCHPLPAVSPSCVPPLRWVSLSAVSAAPPCGITLRYAISPSSHRWVSLPSGINSPSLPVHPPLCLLTRLPFAGGREQREYDPESPSQVH